MSTAVMWVAYKEGVHGLFYKVNAPFSYQACTDTGPKLYLNTNIYIFTNK